MRSFPDRAVRVRALARGHCVVFLGKTLNSHGASLHPGVEMVVIAFNEVERKPNLGLWLSGVGVPV